MTTLSIGKLRALQQCSTPTGELAVLALDHRGNLRAALNPQSPQSVPDDELVNFKREVITALAAAASASLLDPEFGAAQCIASGALPGRVGLLVAVEATGYSGDPMARQSTVLPGWSVAKAKRLGANGIKLLVYYHPDSPTAPDVENLVRQVADDCAASDLPLFLEPLSYSLDPAQKKLAPEDRRRVVIESARRLTALGPEVLKAEFPVDVDAEPDEREWAKACAELSEASRVPWVLLSATAGYETYLRQVTVACRAGASGVAVGRAVWKEAAQMTGDARTQFLRGQGRDRMARLTALCQALARPWTEFYSTPDVQTGWYENYRGGS